MIIPIVYISCPQSNTFCQLMFAFVHYHSRLFILPCFQPFPDASPNNSNITGSTSTSVFLHPCITFPLPSSNRVLPPAVESDCASDQRRCYFDFSPQIAPRHIDQLREASLAFLRCTIDSSTRTSKASRDESGSRGQGRAKATRRRKRRGRCSL